MKILMFNDLSDNGTGKSSALREVRQDFENKQYEVDVVNVNSEHPEEMMKKAAGLLQDEDLVIFGNSHQMSGDILCRILSINAYTDDLQQENDALQSSNDSLKANNDALRISNDALVTHNDALQTSNDALQRDNDSLAARNSVLMTRNDSLKTSNDALQAHNEALQTSNDVLQAHNDALQTKNDSLTASNTDLQNRNDSLTASNTDLQNRNDSLTASNTDLQNRNDSLTASNDELQADNDELMHDSREDALTHVLNRRGFNEDSVKFIDTHENVMLISCDINDFKLFNDLYGHHIGDQLLIEISEEFLKLVPDGGIVARSGGDEFQLMIADPTEAWLKEATDFFNSVHSFEFEGKQYTYIVAGGFAMLPEQTRSLDALCRMADSALYHAKMIAKEKLFKYEPEMDHGFRSALGFNARSLARSAPGAMLIYKADDSGDILFANALCAELLGYDSVSDFRSQVKNIQSILYQEDVAKVEQGITHLKKNPEEEQEFTTYRMIGKDGSIRNVFDIGRVTPNEHFGKIYYSFLFDYNAMGDKLNV